jgi:hypothetical protein
MKVRPVKGDSQDVSAWAMLASWALFTDHALKWSPGAIKLVSMVGAVK